MCGFGESFLGLDKAGQTIDLWVSDAMGTHTPRLYKAVPFWRTTGGYGVFVHTSNPRHRLGGQPRGAPAGARDGRPRAVPLAGAGPARGPRVDRASLPAAPLRAGRARLDTMPLYLREGGVIPMGPVVRWVGERPTDPVTVVVAPFDGTGRTELETPVDGREVTIRYAVRAGRHVVEVDGHQGDVALDAPSGVEVRG